MNRHHVFLFLERGEVLAALSRASDPHRSAWVGVYPLDVTSPEAAELLGHEGIPLSSVSGKPLYRVRFFEVGRDLIERDVCISEQDLINGRDLYAFGADDLAAKLADLGVDLEQLERPFKSNYPI
jgi:hypothetical protein